MDDRRTLLSSLAGIAVGGAGMALAGCARTEEEGEVTANEDLMREHGVLRRILIAYREIAPKLIADAGAVDAAALNHAAALFQRFGERYHEHPLEEQHIFPSSEGLAAKLPHWWPRCSHSTPVGGRSPPISSTGQNQVVSAAATRIRWRVC